MAEDAMGLSSNPKNPTHQPSISRHGGLRTMPFIIGNRGIAEVIN